MSQDQPAPIARPITTATLAKEALFKAMAFGMAAKAAEERKDKKLTKSMKDQYGECMAEFFQLAQKDKKLTQEHGSDIFNKFYDRLPNTPEDDYHVTQALQYITTPIQPQGSFKKIPLFNTDIQLEITSLDDPRAFNALQQQEINEEEIQKLEQQRKELSEQGDAAFKQLFSQEENLKQTVTVDKAMGKVSSSNKEKYEEINKKIQKLEQQLSQKKTIKELKQMLNKKHHIYSANEANNILDKAKKVPIHINGNQLGHGLRLKLTQADQSLLQGFCEEASRPESSQGFCDKASQPQEYRTVNNKSVPNLMINTNDYNSISTVRRVLSYLISLMTSLLPKDVRQDSRVPSKTRHLS